MIDDAYSDEEIPHFTLPVIQNNPNGWGPCDMPEQFKDMPYQPFSKGDRLGKVSIARAFLNICLHHYLITLVLVIYYNF